MAKEIKSINVDPSDEEKTINEWQSFGWEFKSTQEVKTADSSHLERRGDTIYNVTKSGDHYVKLTFERDPARKNYAELVSLEKEYNSVPGPGYPPVRFGKVWLIILVFFILAGLGGITADAILSAIICLIIAAGIIVWRSMRYSKKNKQWENDYNNWVNKRSEILEKAKVL